MIKERYKVVNRERYIDRYRVRKSYVYRARKRNIEQEKQICLERKRDKRGIKERAVRRKLIFRSSRINIQDNNAHR